MKVAILVVAVLAVAVVGFVGFRISQQMEKRNCLEAASLRYPVEFGALPADPADYTQTGHVVTVNNGEQRTAAVNDC